MDIFLWMTSGCAVSLCILEILLCVAGFITIYKKDYKILLACSSLIAYCALIVYFIFGVSYAFCAVMTVYVMEDHPKIVDICLLVNLGLGFAR